MIITIIQKKKKPFLYKDGVQLSQDYIANTRRQFIFYPQKFLVLIWSTSEKWQTELTLELPSVFQP